MTLQSNLVNSAFKVKIMKKHIPVLLDQVMKHLEIRSGHNVIDCNLGYGGHAKAILERNAPDGRLIGIDLDSSAINYVFSDFSARESFKKRYHLVNGNFKNLQAIHAGLTDFPVHRVLFDLGVSSPQIESSERGFGIKSHGILDMNFADQEDESRLTAWKIVNTWSEKELARIFKEYGEERAAKQVAQAIVNKRKDKTIDTPSMLVEAVSDVLKQSRKRRNKNAPFNFRFLAREKHPATQVFQALRIAVNDELQNLRVALPQALDLLQPGGRLAVITFHSLEDRIVKIFFKTESTDCLCPRELPVCRCNHKAKMKTITKKPIIPDEKEISHNPRAKSAKLRVAEKL